MELLPPGSMTFSGRRRRITATSYGRRGKALAKLVASELARILESHDDEVTRALLANHLLEVAGSDERGGGHLLRDAGDPSARDLPLEVSGLQVTPRPHQQAILEALEAERDVHDRHWNLVVAATGTGKTVVAALDYRALAQRWGRRPSLLFVAHRRKWKHVFASVQSLRSGAMDRLDLSRSEVVVIDEFHRAEACTYRALLERIQPRELLGLTATPERTDGVDVRDFFDGRAAHEMRLWDAMDESLLVPVHYSGIHDNVDPRSVQWRRGGASWRTWATCTGGTTHVCAS